MLGSAFVFPARAATIAWTNTSGGAWSVAANWSPNSIPVASSDVFITSNGTYTVTMDVSPTISSLTIGGSSGQQTLTNTSQTLTLSLASVVNTNGVMGVAGGSLNGLGSLSVNGLVQLNGATIGSGFSVTVQSNAAVNILATTTINGPVTNLGTINWLAGNILFNAGIGGTIWNQANGLFDIQCDQLVFQNSGLPVFHNAGLLRKRITASSTTFSGVFLDNTGSVQSLTGTILFSSGSNLGGSFQADSGAAITFNGGTYMLSSPPNFQGPGPVLITGGNLTLNAFTGTFTLTGGTLAGQNTIADTGLINLNGTSLGSGASLTLASNAVVNIQAATTINGAVTNLGTINWLAGNILFNAADPAIWNQANGLFDIQCDRLISNNSGAPVVHNAGLLRKRITAGSTTFSGVFLDNTGSVQALTGTILFSSGGNLGGSFQASSGAAITFNGGTYTLSAPPNFQGPGPVLITGGNLTLSAFTGTFTAGGPTLVGQNTVAATGTINLNGSPLSDGASLTLASNAVLNIQAATTLNGAVTNLGTINWLAGNILFNAGPGGTIWNQANGLFDIQCDRLISQNSGVPVFHNAGLLRKRITAGSTTFSGVFLDNSGTIQAQTGVIGIQGSYSESPTATLAISLSALEPGTGFGKIQFAAKPTFVGKLTLATLGGYRPNPGDSFAVISYPSAAGDFTSLNGLDLGSGLRLVPSFSASGLTLVAASYAVNPVPSLTLDRSVSGFLVAWPVNFTGWQLQSTTNLATHSWTTVPVAGTNNTVLAAGPQGYFRLFQ